MFGTQLTFAHFAFFLQLGDKTRNTRRDTFDGRKEKEKARRKEEKGSCSEKGEGCFSLTWDPSKVCLLSTSYILSPLTLKGDFHLPSLQLVHITCPKQLNHTSPEFSV